MPETNIGIITLHRNTNYGANLQAFATSRFLNNNGFSCQVVDYLPSKQDWENHIWGIISHAYRNEKHKDPLRLIKMTAGLAFFTVHRSAKLRSFSKFRKAHIPLTESCESIENVENLRLKTIICGSDQIWNANITQGIRDIYYGRIAGVEKRIAYAASIGGYQYPEAELERVRGLIKDIDYCSVREEKTREYIRTISDREPVCVCDPVFLLEKEEYYAIASRRLVKERYVLLYGVINNPAMTSKAKQYAKDNGLALIEIGGDGDPRTKHKQFAGAGPDMFISAIKDAEVVFTNSFHGVAMSIILEKDFFVFDNPYGGSRLTDLLGIAKLSERMVNVDTDLQDYPDSIEYKSVCGNLEQFIRKSREFLLDSVETEVSPVAWQTCVGCGACMAVCKNGAIRLVQDVEGFPYAVINHSKCTNCGLCKRTCPVYGSMQAQTVKAVYAFKAADEYRVKSTSGGAFSALAEYILKCSGVVYGAAMDGADGPVFHIRATSEQELDKLRGVKYIQSDTRDCFKQIKQDLENGKTVLFSGTPCQISAVKKHVEICRVPSDNLFLVDIICHGVSSPRVFSAFIRWLNGKLGGNVTSFLFRDKKVSWRGNSSSAHLEDGRWKHSIKAVNAFMNTYYSGTITRESCYHCQYASTSRVSDMTISDFWGIEKKLPSFEDALGVSMVLVNTEKGAELVRKINGDCAETDLMDICQPQLSRPCDKPTDRGEFWRKYNESGIESVLKQYGGMRNTNRLASTVHKLLEK